MDRFESQARRRAAVLGAHGDPRIGQRRVVGARARSSVDTSAAALAMIGDFVPFGIGQALGVPPGGNSLDNTLRVAHRVPTEWVLADVRVHAIADGFGHGLVHLWAEDGTLLGTASQSTIVRSHTAPDEATADERPADRARGFAGSRPLTSARIADVNAIDELLAGATERTPLVADDGKSGVPIERVVIDGQRYIAKHMEVAGDWLAARPATSACGSSCSGKRACTSACRRASILSSSAPHAMVGAVCCS